MSWSGPPAGNATSIPAASPVKSSRSRATRSGPNVGVSWRADVLALSYKVYRSADPTLASAFTDVTAEDPTPTDTTFMDASTGSFAAFIITSQGPDGEGPWGHFGQ